MKRAVLLGLLAAAVVVFAVVVVVPKVSGDSTGGHARKPVNVVFDDARGLVPGQVVQMAGARVGTIKKVSVTPGYRALIHTEIDERFVPFHKDATCTIKPQGLIAENYVECDPGSPSAGELKAKGGGTPTVPVKQTTEPVSLTDLFQVWNAPTADRVTLLFSMLGMGTAGRGQDFNDVLRRANPSLALARKTIGILNRQRAQLAETVDSTTKVTAALAKQPKQLTALVRHAGRVSVQTATHRGALAEGVRQLPPLLAQATPALQRINAVLDSGKPLVDQLGNAAPGINQVAADIPRLSSAALPTLKKLTPVLHQGAQSARRSAPVTKIMAQYAHNSRPSAEIAGQMFPTLEARGFNGDLLNFFYNAALAAARYDNSGHIIPAHVGLTSCGLYASSPSADCGAQGASLADGTTAAKAVAKTGKSKIAVPKFEPNDPATTTVPPADAGAPAAQAPAAPGATQPDHPGSPLSGLLEYLLG